MKPVPPKPALRYRPLMPVLNGQGRLGNIARDGYRHHRDRGLSLIELLLSLAISAMLLTATMVALDVSFRAYADAAEQASTQAATRMVTNRMLTLMRTSTEYGPLEDTDLDSAHPDNPFDFNLVATVNGDVITSNFINMFDSNNNDVFVAYDDTLDMLVLSIDPPGAVGPQTQPILGGVTNVQFSSARRLDDDGLWVLSRGTMDITVQPDTDTTLAIENGNAPPIRVIGSTMPRKVE